MLKKHTILLLASMTFGACGTMPEERAISGGGIGAASGAIIGAVTGLTVVQGAAIGAVAGALTGVLTDKDKVNLGEPVWKQKQSTASVSGPQSSAEPATADQTGADQAGHQTVADWTSDQQAIKAGIRTTPAADKRVVMEIQSGLIRLGYNPGPVDGINGQRTSKAICDYQKYHGLNVDGQATVDLAEHIRSRNSYFGGVTAKQISYPL